MLAEYHLGQPVYEQPVHEQPIPRKALLPAPAPEKPAQKSVVWGADSGSVSASGPRGILKPTMPWGSQVGAFGPGDHG